jgi:uncharacterized protein (TIGR03000 family)
MYSMVLMVALSGGGEVPDWGRGGCYGGGYGGFAGCFGGYYGYGCHGTCYGYSAGGLGYGCWGGGYGCWGAGYGCYGSGSGCWGAGYGCYGSGYASWGCGGGYAWGGFPYGTGWGLANASPVLIGTPGPPAVATTQRAYYNPGNSPVVAASAEPDAGTPGSNRAALVVHMPAGAKLTVDNTATKATSDTRRFVTPPLEPGATYRYVLRGELDRNGQKVTASQNVEVRAGKTSEVYLDFPGQERVRQ